VSPPTSGPQIGRNDPCPCGSGKKFKKCCGGIETPGATPLVEYRQPIVEKAPAGVHLCRHSRHGFVALKIFPLPVPVERRRAFADQLVVDMQPFAEVDPGHPSPLPVLHCGFLADLPVRWQGLPSGLAGEDVFAVVQPYVHGPNLRELVQGDSNFGMSETAAVAASIAKQLARRPDAPHLNLKPGNVLIGSDGQVYLSDARQGFLRGPTRYTAPEQLTGPGVPKSDSYALGILGQDLMSGWLRANG
jgi:serine/threonine protein kinase